LFDGVVVRENAAWLWLRRWRYVMETVLGCGR
jgi:hypothetical protein